MPETADQWGWGFLHLKSRHGAWWCPRVGHVGERYGLPVGFLYLVFILHKEFNVFYRNGSRQTPRPYHTLDGLIGGGGAVIGWSRA